MSRDLLSGLLPNGDPFSPFDPEAYRASVAGSSSTVDNSIPPLAPATEGQNPAPTPPPTPPEPLPAESGQSMMDTVAGPAFSNGTGTIPVLPEPSLGPVAPINKSPSRKSKRKRRASYAGPIMAAFAVLMFLGIAGCLYLLLTGRGVSTDFRVIATRPDTDQPDRDVPVGGETEQRPAEFDPVMGNVKPRTNPPPSGMDSSDRMQPSAQGGNGTMGNKPQQRQSQTANGSNQVDAVPQGPSGNAVKKPAPASEPKTEPETEPIEAAGTNMTDAEMTGQGMTGVAMAEQSKPDSAKAEAGQAALEKVRAVLRSGRLAEMSAAVQNAESAMIGPEQEQELASYALLVELAEYYFEGVRRGSANLGLGETFDITPGFTVGVVEGTRDKLALKVNGKIKSYSMDEIPLVLADRLTKFALPENDPEVVAGRAAYQALWSQATAAHRAQSIDWLTQIADQSERFDARELADAINHLFDN